MASFSSLTRILGALAATGMLLASSADAFWRLPCRGRSGLARIDPLVNPNTLAHHVHAIHGGSNLGISSTSADLRASECTSCGVKQDKSAYWTPPLYFQHDNGTTEILPQVGGMLVYYLLLGQQGEEIKAFPNDFSMLAGDTRRRNFTIPIPDPPKSEWTSDDMTDQALSEKSVGFNCLNYGLEGEPTLFRHFLPDSEYIFQHCSQGIRAEMMFPSCWNGKPPAADHRSHMAYPNLVIDGECPDDFPIRVPSLLYETIWDTSRFQGQSGRFVLANGDPTGAGYHADFLNGWDDGVLQEAIEKCKSPTGLVEKCLVFDLQTEDEMKECKIQTPRALLEEDAAGPLLGLPNNVPIQEGPEYATMPEGMPHPGYSTEAKTSTTDKPTTATEPTTTKPSPSPTKPSSVHVSPSLGYTPGTNRLTDNHGGVITIAAATETEMVTVTPTPTTTPPPPPPPPQVNVAPEATDTPNETAPRGRPVSTSVFTDGNVVSHIVIEVVDVTVTVTPTPRAHHRRHVHHN